MKSPPTSYFKCCLFFLFPSYLLSVSSYTLVAWHSLYLTHAWYKNYIYRHSYSYIFNNVYHQDLLPRSPTFLDPFDPTAENFSRNQQVSLIINYRCTWADMGPIKQQNSIFVYWVFVYMEVYNSDFFQEFTVMKFTYSRVENVSKKHSTCEDTS